MSIIEVTFLGAGDALWAGKDWSSLFVGVGPRSDVRALPDIHRELGGASDKIKVIGCKLIDPRLVDFS